MRNPWIVLTLVLAALVAFSGGCKTTMVGPEGQTLATYSLGSLKGTINRDITAVYNATVKAMQDLELSVTTKNKDALSGQVIARDAQDKKVSVELDAVTEDTTGVKVQAGMGGEARCRLVYQHIRANL